MCNCALSLSHSPTLPNPSIGQAGAAINPVNNCLYWKSPKFGFPNSPHSHPKPLNFAEIRNGGIGLTANFALPNPEGCSGCETKCRLHALRTKQGRLFDATRLIWRPPLLMPSLNLCVCRRSKRTSRRWNNGKKNASVVGELVRLPDLLLRGRKDNEWRVTKESCGGDRMRKAAGFLSSSHDSRPFRATNVNEA